MPLSKQFTKQLKINNMKKTYKIMASSRYGKEEIDTAETLQEAKYLVNEYRLAFGPEFTIYIK
jgi:hypothetical protein